MPDSKSKIKLSIAIVILIFTLVSLYFSRFRIYRKLRSLTKQLDFRKAVISDELTKLTTTSSLHDVKVHLTTISENVDKCHHLDAEILSKNLESEKTLIKIEAAKSK